jgi:hypothetical protein
MRLSQAARTRLVALTLGLGSVGVGLAGCGTVDDALFGNQAAAPTPAAKTADAAPAPDVGAPPSSDTAASTTSNPAAPAADTSQSADTSSASAAPAVSPANDLGLTLGAIEPGADSTTPVGQNVTRLRGELSTLHDKVAADLQQYGTLKSAAVQDVTTYQEAKSHIVIRLQVGTTKGNPELVSAWNTAQSALDTLTGNINSFAALATEVTTDTGRGHTERDAIGDAFNMAGGTDEDHRQLTVLQQEAAQLVGILDRVQAEVTRNVQRQTVFVGHERTNLASLESDIKNGELYAGTQTAAPAGMTADTGDAGKTVVTIKFDRAKVDFEQDLYTALNSALQAKPSASFRVVAVSPTGGSAAAVEKAQRDAQHHAQAVLKSMTDMGVPAARVGISSSTDPAVTSTEVRVYEK